MFSVFVVICSLLLFALPKIQALGTLRHQDSSALNYSAEMSGHFGTGAEVSDGHFGTSDLYETLWHHCIFV